MSDKYQPLPGVESDGTIRRAFASEIYLQYDYTIYIQLSKYRLVNMLQKKT